MVEQINNRSILSFIKDYWFLIIFVGAIIVSWVRVQGSVDSQGVRISNAELKINKQEEVIKSISENLAGINASLLFIKERVK